MFRAIELLRARLPGGIEFHYVGTSDPGRFAEFASISDITNRHGFKDAVGMAATLASMHAGILTSEFEGMPRCVLEMLGVGRPVVAVHLPQLEPVIHDGESGFLVPRSDSIEQMAERLADRFVQLRTAIGADEMDHERIAAAISDFTPGKQLARVYGYHRELQNELETTDAPLPPQGEASEHSSAHE
jgi:glycosyltransferase involved in cell wall biosynthesis